MPMAMWEARWYRDNMCSRKRWMHITCKYIQETNNLVVAISLVDDEFVGRDLESDSFQEMDDVLIPIVYSNKNF